MLYESAVSAVDSLPTWLYTSSSGSVSSKVSVSWPEMCQSVGLLVLHHRDVSVKVESTSGTTRTGRCRDKQTCEHLVQIFLRLRFVSRRPCHCSACKSRERAQEDVCQQTCIRQRSTRLPEFGIRCSYCVARC